MEKMHPKAVSLLIEEAAKKGIYKPIQIDKRTLNFSQYQQTTSTMGSGSKQKDVLLTSGRDTDGTSFRFGSRKHSVEDKKKQNFIVVDLDEGKNPKKKQQFYLE